MTATMNHLSEPNEDYLERIYELVEKKGYVRVTDIAEDLEISTASVSKMLQKLAKTGHITREPYRGFTLTEKGKNIGKKINIRHKILYLFLKKLGLPESIIKHDIDGLEHHLSNITLSKLSKFLKRA